VVESDEVVLHHEPCQAHLDQATPQVHAHGDRDPDDPDDVQHDDHFPADDRDEHDLVHHHVDHHVDHDDSDQHDHDTGDEPRGSCR
jgi:hypothetical protein